jgi:TPR repeat protein
VKPLSLITLLAVGYAILATLPAHAASNDSCPAAKESYPLLFDAKLDALDFTALKRAADRGNANALALLGLRYTGAEGGGAGVKPDLKQAIAYFRKSAAKSDPLGEYLLAVAYITGTGVEKDEARAFGLFRRAADHGHPNGRYWVGEMTAKGRGGVTGGWESALPIFSAAAAAGAPDAYVELGYMYENGLGGLTVDYQKAAFCYRQGGQLKSQIAQFNLRNLIDRGHVVWQTGDPGQPPKPAIEPYRVK